MCLVTVVLLLLPYLSRGPVSIMLALAYSCLVLPVLMHVQHQSADDLRDYVCSKCPRARSGGQGERRRGTSQSRQHLQNSNQTGLNKISKLPSSRARKPFFRGRRS